MQKTVVLHFLFAANEFIQREVADRLVHTHTLFKSYVCLRNQTAPNTGLDTEQIKLTYKVACATHTAVRSLPPRSYTELPSPENNSSISIYLHGIQVTFAYFSMSESYLHHTICRGLKTKREY